MSSQLRLSLYGALATMATSLSLLSVFSSMHWFFPVEIGVVLVAGSCALIRRSPLPSAFEPIVAAAVVLLWVTVLYARSDAWLGLVPTGATFRQLADVARNGFTEIRQLPTPAPPHDGLVMLTVIGVAAIALVVDLMTVTLRRAALSGLPLLALFTVCAATGHHGVGIVAFIASAIGYLWLLYADNREKVARWGAAVGTGSRARPASAWSTDLGAAPAPASLGRQVGAVAISVGVLLPLFIPGLHTGINKHGRGGGTGGGGSVQTFDPLVRVGADLASQTSVPVLSYKTSAVEPSYLRLTSLDVYDGTSFTEASLSAPSNATASEALPVVPPIGAPVTTSVDISPSFEAHWLPVQSTALGVDVGKDWRYDPLTATIFSATTTTRGLHYTTRSVPNEPTANQLDHAGRPTENLPVDLALPKGVDPAVVALTHQITRHAKSRYQAALAIERFFTTGNRFTYSTNVPTETGGDALAHFLLDTRRGFCQQYAAAMTVMARLSGIPARVAVGFTRGRRTSDQTWHVSTHDAHAWPELWFQGYGWLPFEPTPRGDGQAVTPSYAQGLGKGSGNGGHQPDDGLKVGGGAKKGGKSQSGPHLPDQGGKSVSSARHHHHRTADIALTVLWVALILLGVLLLVPGIARVVLRRRRWRRMTHRDLAGDAAWLELRDTALDFGLPWSDDRSPRQIAGGLLRDLDPPPAISDVLSRLAGSEERSRYAATADADTDLKADVLAFRGAAAHHASRRTRMSARLLPKSTVGRGRAIGARGFAGVERVLRWFSPVRGAMWLRARIASG